MVVRVSQTSLGSFQDCSAVVKELLLWKLVLLRKEMVFLLEWRKTTSVIKMMVKPCTTRCFRGN